MVFSEPDRSVTHEQLAQHVSDPPVRGAAADAHHPLTKHGGVDQCVAPERIGNGGKVGAETEQASVRNKRDPGRNEGAQTVIHDFEVEALQVGNVAGNMKRHDLPPPAREELVTADKAVKDKAARGGPLSVADDILVGGEPLDCQG